MNSGFLKKFRWLESGVSRHSLDRPSFLRRSKECRDTPPFILTILFLNLFVPFAFGGSKIFNPPVPMVVAVPVANVRAKPIPHSGKYENDPLQETQVEKGEPVLVYEKNGNWYRIEAPEQQEFTHHSNWEGYPGWVEAGALTKDLSQHHRLKLLDLPENDLRKKIMDEASLHLGSPYLWGGRSLHDPKNNKVATGVDCSGLINWSFRQVGRFIPRDAHEQYLRARPVEPIQLKPADLIFLADEKNPQKIIHVALFAGGDEIIEAPQSGEKVRKISGLEKFGKQISLFKNGENVGGKVIYFGTFLTEGQ